MSAQNLLFSNLPVSSLGLYDSTTQTIQTINSDASGNINLNSNSNVNGNLAVTESMTVYNDLLVNESITCNTFACGTNTFGSCATGTLNVTQTLTGVSADFSATCNAQVLALDNLTTSNPFPAKSGQGQIVFYNGGLYFYNAANNTYYQFNLTEYGTSPP